jgi:hypothetical protein
VTVAYAGLRKVLARRDLEVHDLRNFRSYVLSEIFMVEKGHYTVEEALQHIKEYADAHPPKDYRNV